MFQELFGLALNNLLRARARLVMTAGGVLVGTSAVILLIALTIGMQQAAEASIGSSTALTEIQVFQSGRPMPSGEDGGSAPPIQLNNAAVRSFYQIAGVAVVIPSTGLQGGMFISGKYNNYASIQGIDPALLPYLNLQLESGEMTLENGALICGSMVQQGFYDPKSENYEPITVDMINTPLKMELNGQNGVRKQNVKVAGIFAPGGNYDYSCFMNFDTVIGYNEWMRGSKTDWKTFQYDQILVRAKSREVTNDVTNAIRKMGYGAGGMGDYLNSLNGYFSTMRLMLGGVGGVALLVAAFGVANTMTMAILERTREIGLMKAIGASDSHILTVFLLEAAMVGLSGGLSGVAVSLILQRIINQAVANAPQQEGGMSFLPVDPNMLKGELVVIPSELVFFTLALATLVGIAAGLYPALRAARMLPVVALKTD